MCEHEICLCNQRGESNTNKCRCSVLSSYARACSQEGVNLEHWRDVSQCEERCETGTFWSSCGSIEDAFTCDHVRKSEIFNETRVCFIDLLVMIDNYITLI